MIIPFNRPTLGKEESEAVLRVLSSGWLAAGPETEAFEKEFANYVGAKYAIFTNSCTSALKMAYKWAKDRGFTEYLLLTPNTFCATYSAAEEIGLRQITLGGLYISVATHYGGVAFEGECDIEDSAHRIEPNDPLIGKIRCYSFYATKNMTTGSGGMFVTNDKEIYEKARLYWRDGLSTSTYDRQTKSYDYEVKAMAGGYDGNDITAAIGRAQLRKLDYFNAVRRRIRDNYNIKLKQDWQGIHLYPYFVKSEEEVGQLVTFLRGKGIGTGYHYPGTGWLGVSLPIYPLLTFEEQEYIIKAVKEWEDEKS